MLDRARPASEMPVMNEVESDAVERPQVKTVVVVNDHAFVNGGQAKVAIETALILRLAGFSVYFFSGVGPEDNRLHHAGVHCICLHQHDILTNPARGRAAIDGMWNTAAARTLRGLLSRLDPRTSIVHVHGWAKCLSP